MPWADNDFFEKNDKDIDINMNRYREAISGKYTNQKELHDAERKIKEETLKTWNRQVPTLPSDLATDDTGSHFATSHRCHGKTCALEPPKSDKYATRPVIPESASLLQKHSSQYDNVRVEGMPW